MERQPLFLDPHEIPTPEGAEGWEEMYPRHWVFGRDREEEEDSKVWFHMSLQVPSVIYPIDYQFSVPGLGHAHSHANALFAIPTSFGLEARVLNGYFYGAQPHEITEPKMIEERLPIFRERVKFYVDNWGEIWRKWVQRNLEIIEKLEEIKWPELKLVEDWETGGIQAMLWGKEYAPCGLSLLKSWNEFKKLLYERLYLHFEILNLSYTSYGLFQDYCLKSFPGMEQREAAAMLVGGEQPILEGDFRLRELAQLAVKLGIQETIKKTLEPEEILKKLEKINAGREWLNKWEESKYWFHITTGNAMYHYHVSWLDNLSIPFKFLRSYISDVEGGKELSLDREEKAREAVRLFEGYRELLSTEEEKKAFTEVWEGATKTAPAIEGHAFYNDHWLNSVAYRKLFELGEYLYKYGIFGEPGDIRFLQAVEVEEILHNLEVFWYTQLDPCVKPVREKIEKRKSIIEVLENWTPPAFLVGKNAKLPEKITEPLFTVLWGLTREKLETIVNPPEKVHELQGWGGSPGVYEGSARVIHDPVVEFDSIKDGDILVTPFLGPAQVVAFGKIKGLVTDTGGVMSHPAIVAREYGMPAVVGTSLGTSTLKDGMKIRVDGTKGSVAILE